MSVNHLPESSTQLKIPDRHCSGLDNTETEITIKDSEKPAQDLSTMKSDRNSTKEPLTKALCESDKMESKQNTAKLSPESETQTTREPVVPSQEGDDWLTAFYLYFDQKSSASRNDGVSFSSQAAHSSTSLLVHYAQENALARAVAGQQSQESVVSASASEDLSEYESSKQRKELQSQGRDLDSRYPCPHCSAAFRFPSKLERHLQSHTGERPFYCTQCNATFSCQSNLGTHERTHSGEKPFLCPHCDSAFSRSSNLKLHLRVHTGERPFPCTRCSSAFKSSTELKRHQKTHTGERPYKCRECESAFTQASSLSSHKKKHTGEKKFACMECDAHFATASYLKIHSRVHTGVKPYSCSECHALFTQSSSLKKHVQVVHSKLGKGGQQFVCASCSASFSRICDLIKHGKVHEQHSTYAHEEKRMQIESVQTGEEAWDFENRHFKVEVDSDDSETN